jgi:N-glycosidase YbiA
MTIRQFTREYTFLSNFSRSIIEWQGHTFPTVEHAYQWEKMAHPEDRARVLKAKTPGDAKRMGRRGIMRPGWDRVKDNIMLQLLRYKFQQPLRAKMLLETGDEELQEGNNWGDYYWGICNGFGENRLGKLLMQVRAELEADLCARPYRRNGAFPSQSADRRD